MWAAELYPIGPGPFEEDSETFHERGTGIIDDLEPGSVLEHALAKRVASALVRLDRVDRVDRYESAITDAINHRNEVEADHANARARASLAYENVGVIYGTEKREQATPSWQSLARALRDHSPDPNSGEDSLSRCLDGRLKSARWRGRPSGPRVVGGSCPSSCPTRVAFDTVVPAL